MICPDSANAFSHTRRRLRGSGSDRGLVDRQVSLPLIPASSDGAEDSGELSALSWLHHVIVESLKI